MIQTALKNLFILTCMCIPVLSHAEFKAGSKNKTDENNNNSWSTTKNKILESNKDNVLLEFTATAEINNNPNNLKNGKYFER